MFHPAAKPGAGAKTRLTFNAKRTRAAPRLRQSPAALDSVYGLNEGNHRYKARQAEGLSANSPALRERLEARAGEQEKIRKKKEPSLPGTTSARLFRLKACQQTARGRADADREASPAAPPRVKNTIKNQWSNRTTPPGLGRFDAEP